MKIILLLSVVLATAWGESDPDWLADLKQKVPQTPECGNIAQDKILAGDIAEITDYPWTVLLEYKKPGNVTSFACAGSLINERYVLTAAHCVEGISSDMNLENVVLGEWNTETDPDCDFYRMCGLPVRSIEIEKTFTHPNYRSISKNKYDDIALLRLATPVEFSDFVAPICLPLDPLQWNKNYTNQQFKVAGWGKTESRRNKSIKRHVDLPFRPFDECESFYRKSGVTLKEEIHMCAGVGGRDDCVGDDGSALMYFEDSRTVLFCYAAGITSFSGSKCGDSSLRVYTKVENYLQWIAENIYQ